MMSAVTPGLSPTREVLDNGLVAIVQETRFSPAITISIALRAGSIYEPEAQPGLARFLGRVLDRGTATRSAEAIAEALDDRGVTLHVSTNRHLQTIACTCLSEDFHDVLTLMADVIVAPIFAEEEIQKRRAEAINSIRQDLDNPSVRAGEALQALLYGADHPYGRPSKGTVEGVERFSRSDLLTLHRRRYAPAVATAVIVGDVDAAAAEDEMARAFSGWSRRESEEVHVEPPAEASSRRESAILMADKSQSAIAYGFVSIERLHPAFYGYTMMNTILGQFGLGGRLAENIRERQGMAYYAFSSFDPSLGPGPLVIRAGVDPRNVERAVAAIDAEVRALGEAGPTDREMAETRQYLIGSIPRMLENNQSIAAFLHQAEFFGLGLDHDRRLADHYSAVTIDEVRAAAAEVLRPDRAALAVAGPATA